MLHESSASLVDCCLAFITESSEFFCVVQFESATHSQPFEKVERKTKKGKNNRILQRKASEETAYDTTDGEKKKRKKERTNERNQSINQPTPSRQRPVSFVASGERQTDQTKKVGVAHTQRTNSTTHRTSDHPRKGEGSFTLNKQHIHTTHPHNDDNIRQ